MANYVSMELDAGRVQIPSYAPYIGRPFEYSKGITTSMLWTHPPWNGPTSGHPAAFTNWTSGGKANAPKVANLPHKAWMLYWMQFLFTADIFGPWGRFGGLAAQLNYLPIILHLTTTEISAAAVLYRSLLSSRLEAMARSRAESSDAVLNFEELLAVEQAHFMLHAIDQAARPSVPDVGHPANRPAGRLPNRSTYRNSQLKGKLRRCNVYAAHLPAGSDRAHQSVANVLTPFRETTNRHRR